MKDKGFKKKTRYGRKERWKPVLAMVALGAVIAQLIFLGFYNAPTVVLSDENARKSDSVTPVLADRDADKGPNIAGSKAEIRSENENIPIAMNRKAKTESRSGNGINTVKSSDAQIKDLLRFASVEINFEPDSVHAEGTQGSGVIIAVAREGFEVLTACHVVSGKNKITVVAFHEIGREIERSEYRNVSILSCDENSDLARLMVVTSDPPKRFVPIMQATAELMSPVADSGLAAWSLSWSDDGTPVPKPCLIKSHVSAQRVPGGHAVGYWVLNGPSVPGMSGGPLLNQEGLLIGIASGNSSGAAYYLDEFEISLLMNRNSPSKTKENP